ncbi:MAG: ParA family protein [Pseudomonadales bacterium]|nr:ParA family protein [Pseudomonadales bacterium]
MIKNAVTNKKGGVGKSTSAINFAASAAQKGKKALLIDLDPQGTCTSSLGIDELSIRENFVLEDYAATRMFYEKVPPSQLTISTEFGFDIIPAGTDLMTLEQYIPTVPNGDSLLLRVFSADKNLDYDLIIFDTPGFIGHIVASVINVTGDITIPNLGTPGSTRSLIDVLEMIEEMNEFRESFPGMTPINIRGHFFCRAEPNTIIHKDQDKEVSELLGDVHLKEYFISKSTEVAKSEAACKPIVCMLPEHKVSVEYRRLFDELFKGDF